MNPKSLPEPASTEWRIAGSAYTSDWAAYFAPSPPGIRNPVRLDSPVDPWDLPRAMDRQIMQVLRVTSLTEGVSYLVLLLVAMPMKYGFGIDAAVT